jgi:hypothetical protein
MKALKSQVQLLMKLAEGEFNHNELSNRWGLRIVMTCNDFGYYGDITFDFYQTLPGYRESHVLTYETQLAFQKAKPGHYTNAAQEARYEKVVAQLKAALTEAEYPVVPEQWQVVNASTQRLIQEPTSDGLLARVRFVSATAEEIPAILEYRAAGAEEFDKEDWNCDLDTGEFMSGELSERLNMGYMQGRGAA